MTEVKKTSNERRATDVLKMKDKMNTIGKWQADTGFTLIEMIGVLAVIAVLVALLLPKVFAIMAESKANSLVAAVQTYRTAIVQYYADIGSILPLDAGGTPTLESSGDSANPLALPARLTLEKTDPLNTGANSWVKFNGPYLAKFSTNTPPGFGSSITMRARAAVAHGTAVTGSNRGYDFDNDENSDLPTNADLVFVRLPDVEQQDFERVDAMLDAGLGATFEERRKRGRVKYNNSANVLRIYLTHR